MSRYRSRDDRRTGGQRANLDKLLAIELDRDAKLVEIESARSSPTQFVPRIPVEIVERVEQAGAMTAMGLILSIHRQLAMRRCFSTPLNAAVWRAACSPSKKLREVILGNLAKVPEIFVLERTRSLQGHYRVAKGALWVEGRNSSEC
jgi:hypothetical protein